MLTESEDLPLRDTNMLHSALISMLDQKPAPQTSHFNHADSTEKQAPSPSIEASAVQQIAIAFK